MIKFSKQVSVFNKKQIKIVNQQLLKKLMPQIINNQKTLHFNTIN
jgi:hypothetical protein